MSTGRKQNLTQTGPGSEPRKSQVETDLERYIADVVTADIEVADPPPSWLSSDSELEAARSLPPVDDLVLDARTSSDQELFDFPDTPSLADGGGAWARTADLRPMVERRRNERYEFDNFVVRAVLRDAAGQVTRARVRDMASGGLFVETNTPFPFKSDVFVEVKLQGGRALTVAGRVVFQPESGMAVRLKTDVQTRAFLLAFVDEIVDPNCDESRRELTIVQQHNPEADNERVVDMAALSQSWNRVLRHLDDEAVHQAFIQKCLSSARLDYALEQYRKLQAERPDDEEVTRYLTQVGTILNFQAFGRDEKRTPQTKSGSLTTKLMMIAVFAVAALWAILSMKK